MCEGLKDAIEQILFECREIKKEIRREIEIYLANCIAVGTIAVFGELL